MCFEYDSFCSVYNENVRKARKPHKCVSCKNGIRSSELYTDISGCCEGDWFAYKVCGACELDRYRIHLDELGEGCHWSDSWCAPEELQTHRHHTGMVHSNRIDGQKYFVMREQLYKASDAALRERMAVTA